MKKATPYLLCLPALLLCGLFLYSVIYGASQAFGIVPYLHLTTPTFDYFSSVLTNPEFTSALSFSLYTAGASAVLAMLLGTLLCAALVYNRSKNATRAITLLTPITTAHIIVILFAVSLLGSSGIIPRFLFQLGIIQNVTDVPGIVGARWGWGIIAVYLWKEAPFVAFTAYVIMKAAKSRYAQAAATLGANSINTFIHVILPLTWTSIARAGLIVFVFSFGAYEVPYLLGPTVPRALPVLAYEQLSNADLLLRPQAMATLTVMAGISILAAGIYGLLIYRDRKLGV